MAEVFVLVFRIKYDFSVLIPFEGAGLLFIARNAVTVTYRVRS